jgi:2-polyprenyl-3-methyl-5-hydroxy-6-metoxy-1,4-benzoquinol methylase
MTIVAAIKHYNITDKEWDTQFSRGKWTYLGKVAVERARNSVITGISGLRRFSWFNNWFTFSCILFIYSLGVFMLSNAPKGSLLDVGCGEGALSDFLNEDQKKNYVGIDLSKEAVRIAKTKRNLNFIQASAETFSPPEGRLFDVIVFNEVLYYTEHVEMLKRYQNFLTAEG